MSHNLTAILTFLLSMLITNLEIRAQRIADVDVLPTCTKTPRDRIVIEVLVRSSMMPTWLYQPTVVDESDTLITIEMFPTSGNLASPSYQIFTVPLGARRVGTYKYQINLHPPPWVTPTTHKGTFEVTGQKCPGLPDDHRLMYVADQFTGRIKRSAPNGARQESVFPVVASTSSAPWPWIFGFVVEPDGNRLFAVSGSPPALEKIELRSGRTETIAGLAEYPKHFEAIVADAAMRKIFWAEEVSNAPEPDERIWFTSLDGDEQLPITPLENRVGNLQIDEVNQKLYWNGESGFIKRCNYDGSEAEVVLPGIAGPLLAINHSDAKLYWSSAVHSPGGVHRSNFDGTEIETILPGIHPGRLVFDSDNSHFFWVDNSGASGKIWWARRDGTELDLVVNDLPLYVSGLVFDDVMSKLYWVLEQGSFSAPLGSVMRCNSDGSEVETIMSDLDTPFGITFDFARPRPRIRPVVQE